MTPNAKLSTELSFILPVARNGVKLQMDWIRKQCSLLELNHNLSHSNKHTRLNTSSIQHAYASTTHRQPTFKADIHLTIGDKQATGREHCFGLWNRSHTVMALLKNIAWCGLWGSDLFWILSPAAFPFSMNQQSKHLPTWRNSGTRCRFSGLHKNLPVSRNTYYSMYTMATIVYVWATWLAVSFEVQLLQKNDSASSLLPQRFYSRPSGTPTIVRSMHTTHIQTHNTSFQPENIHNPQSSREN